MFYLKEREIISSYCSVTALLQLKLKLQTKSTTTEKRAACQSIVENYLQMRIDGDYSEIAFDILYYITLL